MSEQQVKPLWTDDEIDKWLKYNSMGAPMHLCYGRDVASLARTVRDDYQSALDAANEQLDRERDRTRIADANWTGAETLLDAANARIASLEAEITSGIRAADIAEQRIANKLFGESEGDDDQEHS